MNLIQRVRRLEAERSLDLAPIGEGQTSARWRALFELARRDVSEARLAEAHVDAIQILHEAGRVAAPGRIWGVWASEHPTRRVTAERQADHSLRLTGTKSFCGGAGLVDDALVTVTGSAGETLLVHLAMDGLAPQRIDRSAWVTPALADASTAEVDLTGFIAAPSDIIGNDRWYLDRPSFWDGAIGPAACWAGAAAGLVDYATAHPPSDPHGRAHLGAMLALRWQLLAVLDRAGVEIDRRDRGSDGDAHAQALTVRHLVDHASAEIAERFARALGPRPLVTDGAIAQRLTALELYRRQCHAERDLERLGRSPLSGLRD